MNKEHGFTLIELAVAMFILVLLLGSILVPLATQVEQRQISDTQRTLEEIKEALIGFTVANGHLPCPDTDSDGAENVNAVTGVCSTIVLTLSGGNLPWQTLGVGNADVWGNRFRYIVRAQYAQRAPATLFALNTTTPNLRVCPSASTCSSAALTSNAVAAVLSHGKNGYGAINAISGTTNSLPTGADELENTDNDRDLVSRVPTTAESAAGEFDDIVTWLSTYILFNRMVAAGKLP